MPVFTTAAASLRARRASRNPSLTTPLTADTANTTPDPATATGPEAPTSPLPESESLVLKAKRAYDRDRQRAKKRKERADRERERIASFHNTSASDAADSGRRAAGARAGAKPKLNVNADTRDRDAYPSSPGVEEIIADVVEREAQARPASVSEPVRVTVHLEQLVKPAKARKSKGESLFLSNPSSPLLPSTCFPACSCL